MPLLKQGNDCERPEYNMTIRWALQSTQEKQRFMTNQSNRVFVTN